MAALGGAPTSTNDVRATGARYMQGGSRGELGVVGVRHAHKVFISRVTPSWASGGDVGVSVGSRRDPGVAGLSGASWDAEVVENVAGVHGVGCMDWAS